MRIFWQTNIDRSFKRFLKNILGFSPHNISIYNIAFQHRSAYPESSNERLEYLGDAVLETVISDLLYNKYPDKDEGFLSQMRSKIVNKEQLQQFSISLGLENFVKANLRPDELHSVIGNVLEALIGAIYLDKNYSTAKKFILNRLINKYVDLTELSEKVYSYKCELIEYAQKWKKPIEYRLVEEKFINKIKIYRIQLLINNRVMAEAESYSKKKAEEEVSEIVYKKLGL